MINAHQRRILHCDMDCFYAAVHMRDDPSLVGRPVVVGGDPAGRGVVAAASYEARRYGIHSAMPAAQAKRRCPETVFLRPDFTVYRQESEAIFAIYRDITPIIQTLSLDEAYLDVSDHLAGHGSATGIAQAIRRRVRLERRLTVSIGVGPNKLVAKIASDFDKPDGLTVVKPHQVTAFLAPMQIRRIHGIGPASEKALHQLDITTVAELAAVPLDLLLERFGNWGRTLSEYAQGIDNRQVRQYQERKSLSTERTFERDLEGLDNMRPVIENMANEVAVGLQRRDIAACTISIKVRYADFTTVTRSLTMDGPTSSEAAILSSALVLLGRTDAQKRAVRLLGVGSSNLVSNQLEQPTLFSAEELNGLS